MINDEKKYNTIIEFILENAKKYRDRAALISGRKAYTYGELIEQARLAARRLHIAGVKKGDRIVVNLEHSERFVIAVLAVLMNGAAYVPVDLRTPEARIEQIIRQSNIKKMIAVKESEISGADTLLMEELLSESGLNSDFEKECSDYGVGESEAYVIFTSGTTGSPKGIPIRNKSVINLVNAFRKWLNPECDGESTEVHKILLMASFSFDMSVFQMFYALVAGQTLDILPDGIKEDPAGFLDYITEHGITVIDTTPLYLDALSEIVSIGNVKYKLPEIVISSGESLPPVTAKRWFELEIAKNSLLLNCYGPTEVCVYASVFPITAEVAKSLDKMPIGTKISGVGIYILDENKRPLPVGETGEIYISGPGLSTGYIALDKLKSETFVTVPGLADGEMLYKTGDQGSIDENGQIFYMGRNDDQTKVQGYRIELEEIRFRIQSIEGINECRVAVKGEGKTKQIVAYIEAKREFTSEEIDDELKKWLPCYMIPAYYVPVTKFERTDRGKLNKGALPDYRKYAIPRKKTETAVKSAEILTTVLDLIKKILDTESISQNLGLIEQGGTSLHFFSLSAAIQRETGVFVKSTELMKASSVIEISNLVADAMKKEKGEKSNSRQIVDKAGTTAFQRLVFTEEKKTKRLIDRYGMKAFPMYNVIYRVKVNKYLDAKKLKDSLEAVIKANDALRCRFVGMGNDLHTQIDNVDIDDVFEIRAVGDVDDGRCRDEAVVFFDISHSPLFKISLLEDGSRNQTLICNFHHAIFDYYSMRLFMEQLLNRYSDITDEDGLHGSFLEYIKAADSNIKTEDRRYWQKYYKKRTDCVFLSGDRSGCGLHRMVDFSIHSFSVDGALYRKLRKACALNHITIYAFVFSCFAKTVMKYVNDNDIIIGTYMNSREAMDNSCINTIGFITNMAGIRFVDRNQSLFDFVTDTQRNINESMEHIAMPYHVIYETLDEEDMKKGKLYEMTFNYIFEREERVSRTGVKYNFMEIGEEPISIPFAMKGFERDNEVVLRIKYCEQIYSPEYIQVFSRSFNAVVEEALKAMEYESETA